MSDLAERLLAGAAVEKKGVFTVDVQKARTKLERFRLENPLLYTVELVQAAVLSGAAKVDIVVDADDFELSFEAERPLRSDDLKDLESAILVRGSDSHPARLQLALATSAAQALRPRLITFVGDGVTLTVKDEFITLAPSPASSVMRFTLKEAFRPGHLIEFFAKIVGGTPEERLLRERCRFASTEIRVNGVVIGGAPWPGDLAVDLVGRGRRGAVGFLPDPAAESRLFLLRAGVLQEEIPWREATKKAVPPGMFAVVDVEALPRDASFARFVRSKDFTALVDGLVRPIELTAPLLEPGILAEHETALSRAKVLAHWAGEKVFHKDFAVIANAPLLRDPQGRPLTLAALKREVDTHGAITFRRGRDDLDPALIEGDIIVQRRSEDDETLLKRMRWSLADGDKLLEGRHERRGRYHDFRNRPAPRVIDAHSLRRVTVNRDGLQMEVALRSSGSSDCAVTVVVDGCRLVTLQNPFPIARLSIQMAGAFTPNQTWDDVVRDAFFADALAHAIAALPTLLDGPYTPSEKDAVAMRDALLPLLSTTLNGDVLWRAACETFGIKGSRKRDLPVLPLEGVAGHGARMFPLIPMFPGGATTLMRLRERNDPLGVVPPGAPSFRPSLPEAIVAGDVLLAIVKRFVTNRPIVSLADEADQVRRRAELLQRAPSSRQIDGVHIQTPINELMQVGGETLRRTGFVGFLPSTSEPGTRLRVFYRGRLIQDRTVPGPVAGLAASIEDDSLTLNADLRVDDLTPLAERALAELPALMARYADAREAVAWVLARRIVNLAFPTDDAVLCWRRLAPSGEKAGLAWRAILDHLERIDSSRVGDAVKKLLTTRGLPALQVIAEAFPATRPAAGRTTVLEPAFAAKDLLGGLLETFKLGQLALHRLDGGAVTLGEMVAAGRVRVIDRGGAPIAEFDDVVIADPAAVAVLTRLGVTVEDVTEALAIARALSAFQARATRTTSLGNTPVLVARRLVDEEGLRGEIGLLTTTPSVSPKLTIEVLREGRALTRLELGDTIGVAGTGIFESDLLNPTADFTAVVNDKRREAFVHRLRDLVAEMCDRIGEDVELRGSPAGRGRLLEFLARERKRSGESKVADRLMDLPLFVDVSGQPMPLSSRSKKKPLRILTRAMPGKPASLADTVVVESAGERTLLERIVPVVIVNQVWETEVLAQAHRARLSPMPDVTSNPTLHHKSSTLGGVRLVLTIPMPVPSTAILHVGAEGLHVATDRFHHPLPFVGALESASAVDNWQRARLSDKLTQTVRREATSLWASALTALGKRRTGDDAEALRDALLLAAVKLARVPISTLTPDEIALRARLMGALLLPLKTGGFTSLDDAVESRPEEHLRMLVDVGLLDKADLRRSTPRSIMAPLPEPAPREVRAPVAEPAQPPPPPKPPEPGEVLHGRLIAELRVVRRGSPHLLSDTELDRVQVEASNGKTLVRIRGAAVVINLTHPVAAAALRSPTALVVLTAAVASTLNALLETFTDDEERTLLLALARHAQTVDAGAVVSDNDGDVIR